MYSIERRSAILELIEQQGKVDVAGLSERFHISRETIRRDLHDLEKDGALKRTHGGAVRVDVGERSDEYPVAVRGARHVVEKKRICRRAAGFVEDGDTVFVDNSSTTAFLANYLPRDYGITVVTNSLGLLYEAAKNPCSRHTYICLGGMFHTANLSLSGSMAMANAAGFYPNKAFFSCTGVQPDSKVADASIYEADVKRMMIDRAGKNYLLVDHTKFQRSGQVFLADFADITAIITDADAQKEQLDYLEQEQLEVLYTG